MSDQSHEPDSKDESSGSTETDFSPTYGQGDEVVILLRDSGIQRRGAIVAESSTGVTIQTTRKTEEWETVVEDGQPVEEMTTWSETWETTYPWTSILSVDQLVERVSVDA